MPGARFGGSLAVCVLVVAFFWKIALTGEYIWFDHSDMCYLEIPRFQFLAREIHGGRFPLWDPSIWAGQPLVGQTQPGPLHPLNLLFLMLPLDGGYLSRAVLNWWWVAIHMLAALCCYALCRDWGRSRAASTLAALGFGCGGFLGTVSWTDVANGAVWTPLILMLVSRSSRGWRLWGNAAVAGALLGLAWLSGHHEFRRRVALVGGGGGGGAVGERRSRLGPAALCLCIAGAVAAPQMLATIEFGRLAKRWVGTAEPVGWKDPVPYTMATVYSMPARGLVETAIPSGYRYADCAPFLGLTLVTLAAVGVLAAWAESRVRWMALMVAVSAAFALGAFTPLHGVLTSVVPGLDKARMPVRAIHLYNLGLCVLAAYGFDRVLERRGAHWYRRAARWVALFGVIFLVLVGVGHLQLDDRVPLTALSGVVLSIAVMAWHRERLPRPVLVGAVLLMAMAEMQGVVAAGFASRFDAERNKYSRLLTRDNDLADALRREERIGPVRVAVNEPDVPYNFGDWHGIDMLQGYVAGVPENLVRASLHTPRSQRLLAVTHYLAREPARPDQVPLFEGQSGIKVFRNPSAMPRAWIVHFAERVDTHDQAQARVQDPSFDLASRTVLVGDAPELEPCGGGTAEIDARGASRVRITATVPCRSMLILADSWYPGWEATVDGAPARVWEAYGVVRGVVVAAGAHKVDLRFRPRPVFVGLAMFGVALVAVAGVWLSRR
jgi:hypothetical protein